MSDASDPAAVRVWRATSTAAVTVLDGLSPACAPFAVWWDAEAGRRRELRTPEHRAALADARQVRALAGVAVAQARSQCKAAREASANPLAARRRAARLAAKTAKGRRKAARADARAARVTYPAGLYQRALQAHAVPAGVVSWLSSQDWLVEMSAGLLGLHAAALYLGRRHAPVAPAALEGAVSVEERQLLDRLHPEYWAAYAAGRGLAGTLTTPPTLGPGGIRCEVRLDGTWTVKALAAKTDSVRALLGARTALRLRITGGARGGWAVLTLATRQATDGVSAAWTSARIPADPTAMSVGVDTETGEEVLVVFDERMLISGASGSGKSWSIRPLMATAHLRGDLVFVDGKGEEATLWDGVCRVAVTAVEINAVIDEVHAEMTRRAIELKRRRLSRWDGPQLTVLIDEGQVVLAQVRRDKGRLQRLVELSSLGRSRGVVLWWATQYPVTDGAAPGVDKMIAPNLLTRFSLRVASSVQALVALDDCADYAPQQIPAGRQYRGHGYLKGHGPRLIRTWTLDDTAVQALPVSVWHADSAPPDPDRAGRHLHLVKLTPPASAEADPPALAGVAVLTDAETAVLAAVRTAAGPVRQKQLVDVCGLTKGTVSKTVAKLLHTGQLARTPDGTLTTSTGEVSA